MQRQSILSFITQQKKTVSRSLSINLWINNVYKATPAILFNYNASYLHIITAAEDLRQLSNLLRTEVGPACCTQFPYRPLICNDKESEEMSMERPTEQMLLLQVLHETGHEGEEC
ncbi:hypothetical protein JTE90_024350 [Oedothorax gibbosus]|uniref:Uncharacterized protein n=1 Tax=Oedothorax gibbosus TaxID=931172 RepID=A0AAV6W048_9ARAC|nr:hypothetical protein JTE90_024350 [Oedothorax gibbosus]